MFIMFGKKEEEEDATQQTKEPRKNLEPESVVIHVDDAEIMAKASSNPSWFGPKRLLFIFCVINLLNYVDRGVMSSNGVNGRQRTCTNDVCMAGTGIQGDFNLTNFEDGILSTAFVGGLLVSSFLFASLAKRFNPFRLIGVGLSVWTIATALCGFSSNFWTIAVFRVFVGVGEASFVSLAAPFIDDNAPVAQKTAWLAAFYMCIPGGIACGYVLGGLVATHFSWRWAFYGEAILMFPWAVLAFVIKPLSLKGKQASGVKADSLTRPDEFNDHTSKKTSLSNNEDKHLNLLLRYWKKFKGSRFYKDMKALFDKVYVVNVFGYVAYNFVIGAYSYWGPKAGYGIYHMDNADTLFGGITIICGIVGTLAGGFILDRMNSTIKNAFKLLSGATFLGAIFCFSAFTMQNVYGFFALFAVGELLVFATQAPVNFVCLHCVKPSLRPLSMAVSTICIHIFGDVPSSPLVGELQDQINNWRTTTLILTSILFLAAAIWFIGIFLDSADKFNEESNQKPLLEGNPIELPKSAVP
ncbi:hypothetical protein IFM89_010004 [Coptis chinensis]|uniref:Major facilitator superfamily (MFS) profile domain-containing protein n=1 Tax=Coptis chinensis TaxID=261450 RepID=A0A835LXF3_9MAGN|nr:hypothetical protein IFM89_010004 [Coptis chinensis]